MSSNQYNDFQSTKNKFKTSVQIKKNINNKKTIKNLLI